MKGDLEQAHVLSWFKAALVEARAGRRTYADIGFHLGKHLDDFGIDEQDVLDLESDELDLPTATLRRLFATEEHPEAGLVDCIPEHGRRDVLKGMMCEVSGYGWENFD